MKVLITGGGGFLGSHLARRLFGRGDDVTVLGRSTYPQFDKSIHCIQVDIRDRDALTRALKGQAVVFHTVAIPGIWGDYNDFYQTNVVGTDNVIAACRAQNVKKLIYTSSPSVVFGQEDLEGVDESVPYPKTYLCHYPKTKAMAEQQVMQADGNALATVCLRPHLIWGPGDPHLVPRLIERARRNKLIRVGDGTNRVDMIYIDNAVEAHVQACDRLEPEGNVAGNCYFVSDGKPVVLWNWIDDVLKKLGLPPAEHSVSFKTATLLGALLEGIYGLLRVKKEPPMTRFLAAQLATSHYFNISRAQRDFGYNPVVSSEEGMDRLVEYFIRQEG
jgi:nucleoside-diphosphate-sugar epimerase